MSGNTWLSSLTQWTFANKKGQEIPPWNTPGQSSWGQRGKGQDAKTGQTQLTVLSDTAAAQASSLPEPGFCQESKGSSATQSVPLQEPEPEEEPAKESSVPSCSQGGAPGNPFHHIHQLLCSTQCSSAMETSGTQLGITRFGHLCRQTDTFYSISSPRFP